MGRHLLEMLPTQRLTLGGGRGGAFTSVVLTLKYQESVMSVALAGNAVCFASF